MNQEVQVSPPNSLVLVMDSKAGQMPESMNRQLVAATGSCVAVGTLAEHDGTTTIRLEEMSDVTGPGTLVFDGVLDTPNREISICSVLLSPYLSTATKGDSTKVRIWANDDREPDLLVVQIG